MTDITVIQKITSSAKPTRRGRILFCRLVSEMLRSGLKLHNAFLIAGDDSEDPAIRTTSGIVVDLLFQGADLHETFVSCPNMFSALHIGLLKGSGKVARYETAFAHIAETEAVFDNLVKRLGVALVQPIIILAGLLLFTVLAPKFFIPQVRAMVADFGAPMPAFSSAVFAVFQVLGSIWFWLGAALVVVAFVRFKRENLFRSESFQRNLSRLCYRIPWVSTILRFILHAHWARVISMQLHSGISFVDANKRIQEGINDLEFCWACKNLEYGIEMGDTISGSMANAKNKFFKKGYFDQVVIGMVRVGEENGNLPELLDHTARFYEEELHCRLDTLEQLLTPVLLTLAGIIVGAWVIAIILPLSNLAGALVS